MLINIDAFDEEQSRFVSFSKNITLPLEYSVNGSASVFVSGNIIRLDGKFRFKGQVSATFNINCDLCLEPFDFNLSFNIDEVFCRSDADFESYDEKNNFWTFSGTIINIEPAVLSDILINMPMKAVCSENCKGLCPVCGCNLNIKNCGCVKTDFNPEFEKLKALFEEDEEEV